MDIFTFTTTIIIAFLGLLTGSIIAYYSEEEIKSFKKYIPFAQLIMFATIFITIFIYIPFFISSSLLILSFSFIFLFWHKQNLNKLDYIVFGVLFALTSISSELQIYMTLLLFIFGILSGALFYGLHRNPKDKNKDILFHKHSGKHLNLAKIEYQLFKKYYFFLIISFSTYIVAQLMVLILF